jgi:hypothetical protein
MDTQQPVLLSLASNLLRLSTTSGQHIRTVTDEKQGIQINSHLIQNSREEFQRVLEITIQNRVFTITDSFSAVHGIVAPAVAAEG